MEHQPEKDPDAQKPVLNYANRKAMKPVVIAKFPDEAEARMAASRLDGERIPAEVEQHISAFGGPSSAVLKVGADDAARAIEILKTTPARTRLTLDEADSSGQDQ